MTSVAIITCTTGRDTLQQAIDSVHAQTHPCGHYVFFNGPPPPDLLVNLSGIYPIHLPKNTGGNGIMNGGVCAAAAYLVTEDYLCFLDDDNWFDPEHVESLVKAAKAKDAPYAYSLRKLINPDGSFWMDDYSEATGHYGGLADVNCYLLHRKLALGIAHLWHQTDGSQMVGDRYVWAALQQNNIAWAATWKHTVNYRVPARWRHSIFLGNIQRRAQFPDGQPWETAA